MSLPSAEEFDQMTQDYIDKKFNMIYHTYVYHIYSHLLQGHISVKFDVSFDAPKLATKVLQQIKNEMIELGYKDMEISSREFHFKTSKFNDSYLTVLSIIPYLTLLDTTYPTK